MKSQKSDVNAEFSLISQKARFQRNKTQFSAWSRRKTDLGGLLEQSIQRCIVSNVIETITHEPSSTLGHIDRMHSASLLSQGGEGLDTGYDRHFVLRRWTAEKNAYGYGRHS